MSIIKPKRIEEYILNHLKNGPILILDLIEEIRNNRSGTTKQAVYAALRQMKQQEMVLTLKGEALLNVAWVNRMMDYFDAAKGSYTQGATSRRAFDLEDGERIKYYFNDAHKADIFWTHAYFLLLESLEADEPVFLYNPHEWFLLARTENEKSVIETTIQHGHHCLITAGGRTFLDKLVRRYFDGEKSQYNALEKPLFKENNYYINIFGDFLIEAWINKDVAERIEALYSDMDKWNEDSVDAFKEILDMSGRMRIVISRNHKKAEHLKKMLRKGFAITKHKTAP
jgi:hypothetical protein